MTVAPPRPTGISSAHAPDLDLPARFMALGMAALALVALVFPFALPLLAQGYAAPHVLAFVHLNTLGVVAAVIMGASYQLVPVVLQTPLASVALGRVTFWLHLSGLALFLPGLWFTWTPGVGVGATLLFSGLLLYLGVIALTIARAPRRDVVAWHIAISLVGLAGGVTLGLLLALNQGAGFLGGLTLRLMAGHATLMLGSWVAVLLGGVSYRLAGMFTLAEDRLSQPVAWSELALTALGAWGVALVVQFLLAIPIETYIQLSSGNFLLTYVFIILTAWRLLAIRRWLAALVSSSLAILALVVAGFQSLWYALAVATLFMVAMTLRRARRMRHPTQGDTRPDAA